ncbi:hypothetical protein [Streptomyces olivochromogenes]|uniref:hypothetical protein n=1 Tax=Streptomyces olivochromogenes TaxID=1963 RepID=UPI0007493756|nr:hypothetical protein [Streptomyces olivochromogenes]KUN35933.1 hypothetical protein AQJ27_47755 [Streptomyces olivochromogenes]
MGGQLVDFVGSLAREGSVCVGADGVAAAGAAVVLPGGGCSEVGFAERVVSFECADQESVGVVEEYDAVLGEELGCLLGERLGDDAVFETRCLGGSGEGPKGSGPGDLLSGGDAVAQAGGGVGGCEDGFDVEDAVDAAAAAAAVAAGGAGVQDGAHVSVLDGERDQAARPAGDVPGQGASEPAYADGAVRIGGDDLLRQSVRLSFLVDPDHEILDPPVQGRLLQRAVVAAPVLEVVVGGTVKELVLRDHALQDTDGSTSISSNRSNAAAIDRFSVRTWSSTRGRASNASLSFG